MAAPADPAHPSIHQPLPRREIGTAWLIFATTVAAYWRVFAAGFIWNDSDYVTASGLRSWHGLGRIWFQLGATEQYYPILHSAFWVEHRIWGDSAFGYHLCNVLLHAAAAVLLTAVLRRLAIPGAWLAGLVFAVHPICVESVAWISEEKNTLSAVFYLLAAWAYLGFDQTRRRRTYAVATAWFVLALLTKSVTATLPGALLLLLWWRHSRLAWKRDLLPLLPWLAFGAGAGLFTAWVERTYVGAHGTAYGLSVAERSVVAGHAIWFYLGKLVWPADLIFIYPHWTVSAPKVIAWIPLAAALAVTAGLAWSKRRAWLAGWLFFGGTLFPTLGFLNVYAFRYSYVADHWQYLACLGIIVPVAARLAEFRIAAFGLVAVLAVLSWRQTGVYHDPETLYRTTLQRNPACWMASQNLASLLLQSGRVPEAIAQFETTLRIEPKLADAENNLGLTLAQLGRTEEGLAHLQRAIALSPEDGRAQFNLGQTLLDLNRPADALAPLEAVVRINSTFAYGQDALGVALARLHRIPEAAERFEAAHRLAPDDTLMLHHLETARRQLGSQVKQAKP